MNENRIQLEDINGFSVFRDVLRNLWVIVLAAAALWMAVGTYGQLTYQAEYTSTVTFAVSSKNVGASYSNLTTTNQLATVFTTVFESDVLKSRVAEELGTPFSGRAEAQVITSTNLLRVRVTASSPKAAFLQLQSMVRHYGEVSDYIAGNAVLTVLKAPNVPLAPSNSLSTGENQRLAAVIGALLAAAAVVLISVSRGTVQTKHGAVRRLEARLYGTIGHDAKSQEGKRRLRLKKPKSAVLITNPLVSIQFVEDCRKLASRVSHHMSKNRQQVLLISSAGENEGKSTVAANLALSLARRGKNVVLVDCDFRRPAMHKIFQIQKGRVNDFGKYLQGKTQDSVKTILTQEMGIRLAVNLSPYEHTQRLISTGQMEAFLEEMRRDADYILIDSPPMMLAADTEGLTRLCDASLLVVRQDWIAARDLNDCLDTLEQGKGELLGYVLNDYREGRRSGGKK